MHAARNGRGWEEQGARESPLTRASSSGPRRARPEMSDVPCRLPLGVRRHLGRGDLRAHHHPPAGRRDSGSRAPVRASTRVAGSRGMSTTDGRTDMTMERKRSGRPGAANLLIVVAVAFCGTVRAEGNSKPKPDYRLPSEA